MRNTIQSVCTLFLLFALAIKGQAQQVADTDFKPPIAKPAYEQNTGPLVLIDEAHFNFHTASGRYLPFAELLRRDGYVVKPSTSKFSKESLSGAKILVIANALAQRNVEEWNLPTPSAFTDEEITAVREWVKGGGSLLLIADHMPFPGGAEKLAGEFGVKFVNGFARNQKPQGGPDVFSLATKSLIDHPILRGRDKGEQVDSVTTFTGSAFQTEKGGKPLFVFGEGFVSLNPQEAWEFNDKTQRTEIKGWLQGATLNFGKGRIAVFGEAAMFSAQLAGPERRPVGMNSPNAKQNPQFLLNVIHWLSGLLGDRD
jgi:hypothetical protein